MRKLLTQKPGRRPLEAVNDLSRRTRRIGLDEQVNVVRHHFHFVNEKAVLGGNLVEQLLEPHINGRNKNGPPVLWTPHKVVLEAEHGSGVFGVSISRHTALYTRRTTNCQHLTKERVALPPPAKAGGPRATKPMDPHCLGLSVSGCDPPGS